MTNREYYNLYNNLDAAYENLSKIYFPARANFYIQSNFKALQQLIQSLINERNRIISHYGKLNDNGTFQITDQEVLIQANKELDELLGLEATLEIKEIPISWLEEVDLTLEQMSILSFMIKED